jgi:hypothetical protein
MLAVAVVVQELLDLQGEQEAQAVAVQVVVNQTELLEQQTEVVAEVVDHLLQPLAVQE